MASLAVRTAHTSQFRPSTVAGIWKSVGSLLYTVGNVLHSDGGLDGRVPRSPPAADPLSGEFSPAVLKTLRLQYRTYSDEGLHDCVPRSPSTAHPLSGEFSPTVLKKFGADSPVGARNSYPLVNCEGFRVCGTPHVVRTRKLTLSVSNKEDYPIRNCIGTSRNVVQESWHDSPRQGFADGKELPVGSACGCGNIHLPSASMTSEAIANLKYRRHRRLSIDSYMFVDILKTCSMQKDLTATRQVHDFIIQSGMQKHPYVATTLLNVYIKCGRLQDAHRVFDGLERTDRNVITWNVIIGAYAKSGCGMEAYRLFLQMKREGFIPDAITYMSILNASASAGALEWVKEVHGHALRAGLESNLRLGGALVHMYAKSGSIGDARLLFDRLGKRDVFTWNIMIGAYAESGCGMEAYRLFLQMKREGFIPNAFTYSSILNPSASSGALEWVKEVHGDARRAGLDSNVRLGNSLVHMYAKSGSIDDARLVFDRMKDRDIITWNIIIGAHAEIGRIADARLLFDRMAKRNVITWNIMIGGYAESGYGVEAYGLFLQMKREGFIPDAFTYSSILNPSASAGALEWVKEVHGHARGAGLELDLRVGTALVDVYAKSGSVDDARVVFDRMEERDVVTWTAMIGGLALHGCGDEALKLFRKMNADRVKPNGATFVAVLSACSHAGLLDDGRELLLAMTQDHGVEPTVVHYTCMVDLLGRAGLLEEAKLLIDNMPVEPNAVTWTALLGACRTYNNVDLGELAAKEALKLEPKDAGAYVLLSNIYAAAGKWEKVISLREMMQKSGVRKDPGRSWIEVDNKIHEFVVGDKSHPETSAIYSVVQELTEKLKAKGYIPDTRLVLHNIHEEDKELALCLHSEKLAIAYGLLRVPRGKSIRVQKNLRVCPDCHAATKLISEVTGREIIVRDANRFHRFKEGVCSCRDYW